MAAFWSSRKLAKKGMPFFKRKDSCKDTSEDAKTNGNGGTSNGGASSSSTNGKEKINYKARLEHKMYLVSKRLSLIERVVLPIGGVFDN